MAGTDVAFDVNDAGRTALGSLIGPEVAQIEGRLLSEENGEYVVAVKVVRFLRGGEQVWTGERVTLRPDQVRYSYERRFSPGRSAALGAVAAGGVAAFIVTRSLLGSGTDDSGSPPGPPGTSLIRP